MRSKRVAIAITVALSVAIAAATAIEVGDDGYEIVEKSQDLVRGETAHMTWKMHILNPDYERTMTMESWSSGLDKSFILVLSPDKEKGNTFLKVGNNIWQYVKKVDEEMKIMPTMMYQGMLGSEFTYDDMVREDSFADDYTAKVVIEKDNAWVLKLTPNKGTGITYKYLLYKVEKETYLPIYVKYYDKKGLVRQLDYSEIKTMGGRKIPTEWAMTNKRKEGRVTTIWVTSAEFDVSLDDSIFTKSNLRRAGR
jgi:outer membrane lipoprotein-sorting protein